MAVRGVGEKAVEAVIDERRKRGAFTNLYEFCERVDLRHLTRATLEALVKCGAFSSLNARRAQLLAVLERAIEMGQQAQNDKRMGQLSMFGSAVAAAAGTAAAPAPLPGLDEFPGAELLKFEKEFLGFYITSHPLTEHQATIERCSTHSTKDAMACSEGTEVMIGGMINRVKTSVTKQGRSAGQKMAWITLEDLEGGIEGVIWAETLAAITQQYPDIVALEQIVFVKGRIDRKRETPSLVINDILPVAQAVTRLTTALVLKLDRTRHNPETIAQVKPILATHAGRLPIYASVSVNGNGQSLVLRIGAEHGVKPCQEVVDDLEQVLGSGAVQLVGAGSKRRARCSSRCSPMPSSRRSRQPARLRRTRHAARGGRKRMISALVASCQLSVASCKIGVPLAARYSHLATLSPPHL